MTKGRVKSSGGNLNPSPLSPIIKAGPLNSVVFVDTYIYGIYSLFSSFSLFILVQYIELSIKLLIALTNKLDCPTNWKSSDSFDNKGEENTILWYLKRLLVSLYTRWKIADIFSAERFCCLSIGANPSSSCIILVILTDTSCKSLPLFISSFIYLISLSTSWKTNPRFNPAMPEFIITSRISR